MMRAVSSMPFNDQGDQVKNDNGMLVAPVGGYWNSVSRKLVCEKRQQKAGSPGRGNDDSREYTRSMERKYKIGSVNASKRTENEQTSINIPKITHPHNPLVMSPASTGPITKKITRTKAGYYNCFSMVIQSAAFYRFPLYQLCGC